MCDLLDRAIHHDVEVVRMGAMSINFTVANEMWLRQQTMNTWGNRSAIINRAVDYWRARKSTTTDDAYQMLNRICMQLMGERSSANPYGNLSEKEHARLQAARTAMKLLIDEFHPFNPEVIE